MTRTRKGLVFEERRDDGHGGLFQDSETMGMYPDLISSNWERGWRQSSPCEESYYEDDSKKERQQ